MYRLRAFYLLITCIDNHLSLLSGPFSLKKLFFPSQNPEGKKKEALKGIQRMPVCTRHDGLTGGAGAWGCTLERLSYSMNVMSGAARCDVS